MRHPEADREARVLVQVHDGHAADLVEQKIEHCIDGGDLDEALRLDQVRREIERVYTREGK